VHILGLGVGVNVISVVYMNISNWPTLRGPGHCYRAMTQLCA